MDVGEKQERDAHGKHEERAREDHGLDRSEHLLTRGLPAHEYELEWVSGAKRALSGWTDPEITAR